MRHIPKTRATRPSSARCRKGQTRVIRRAGFTNKFGLSSIINMALWNSATSTMITRQCWPIRIATTTNPYDATAPHFWAKRMGSARPNTAESQAHIKGRRIKPKSEIGAIRWDMRPQRKRSCRRYRLRLRETEITTAATTSCYQSLIRNDPTDSPKFQDSSTQWTKAEILLPMLLKNWTSHKLISRAKFRKSKKK